MKVARIYQRVSTEEQNLARQALIIQQARSAGYYIAGIYKEKASGARLDRPELQRMITDLQTGEVVIAESIDRLTRLPLDDAENLIATIKEKGATISIPGIIDLTDLITDATGISRVVLESTQNLILRIALQAARDDYENRRIKQRQGIDLAKKAGKYKGRKPDTALHERILILRATGRSIAQTAKLAMCSTSHVKWVCRNNLLKKNTTEESNEL